MMRSVLLALLTTGVAASGLHAQQQVQFFAAFTDQKDEPVTALTAADIRVTENGTPGKIVNFEPVDWPVRVEILVDNGAGVGGENLLHLRNGVRGLIEALPEGVQVTLITTAPQPRNIVRATTDRQALLQGVDRIAPDTGAARFIEALGEAAARFDRDKGNYFPVVVILGSTAAEGGNVIERDVQRLLERFQQRAATVHVVMLSSAARSANSVSGANQTQVGTLVTGLTGGRYENISAPSRVATLLPELGAQVARSHARQNKQFRVTFDRPAGAAGQPGEIGLSAPAGLKVALTVDGHMP